MLQTFQEEKSNDVELGTITNFITNDTNIKLKFLKDQMYGFFNMDSIGMLLDSLKNMEKNLNEVLQEVGTKEDSSRIKNQKGKINNEISTIC